MTDHDVAKLLLDARAGAPASAGIAPADEAQAYRIQALVTAELGPIGGWKVGAPGPSAPPNCAPLPASALFHAPKTLDSTVFTQREVESEICFRFAAHLPPRSRPYEAAELIDAIDTCQPGIEVLQSRLADPDQASALALLADSIQNGAFIWGEPIAHWQKVDFAAMAIRQTIEGGPTKQGVGNPAGDMIRLMLWLANTGAVWAGGIKAGQIVTCGSWTGKTKAQAGIEVVAAFTDAAPIRVHFA
jgi:2-keto-4-pentenoate hydratase